MVAMKIIYTLLTILLASTLNTRADVITQTVDFGNVSGGSQFYFNKFNTALGTLTDVMLEWTINSSISTASITNENTGTVTVSKIAFSNLVEVYMPSVGDSGDLMYELPGAKSVTATGTVSQRTLTTGQSYTLNNVNFNGFTDTVYYNNDPQDTELGVDPAFAAFKGTGTVPLYLANTFGATPTASGSGVTTSWLTSITGVTTGNLRVTYTYDAAPAPIAPVPEPPALILGFGGILGMAGFAFKRRPATDAVAQLV